MAIVQPPTTSPPETAPGWAPPGSARPGWAPPTVPPTRDTELPPPPAPASGRKTGRYVVGAIAALTVVAAIAGSAGRDDATAILSADTTPTTSSLMTWADLYGRPDSAVLVSDMKAIASASTSYDLSGMASSCRTFQRHVAGAQAHLPAPDAALTAELATAYRYFDQAATACITGGTDIDVASVSRSASYLELGAESITRATAILETLS